MLLFFFEMIWNDLFVIFFPPPTRSLDSIPESVLPHFKEAAEQLIKEKGATNVVAAALAYISGAKEITSRSLLSSHQVV